MTALVVIGCYRMEIELASLAEDGSSAGSAGAENAGGTDSAIAGRGGAAGAGGATEPSGGAGDAAGASGCNDELDSTQALCAVHGPSDTLVCMNGDPDGWDGCISGGCNVCAKVMREFPFYFDWHPCCAANYTCGSNEPQKCFAHCPEPTVRHKRKPCFREPLFADPDD